jgi:hypothetical protein
MYDNSLFALDSIEDIQSSSLHLTCLRLGHESPNVTSTKPFFQFIKDVQASFDLNSTKKDSFKGSIDGITTSIHPPTILVTSPTSSIPIMSIHIIDMDQKVKAQEKNKFKAHMNELSSKRDQESRNMMKIKENQDKSFSKNKKLGDQSKRKEDRDKSHSQNKNLWDESKK